MIIIYYIKYKCKIFIFEKEKSFQAAWKILNVIKIQIYSDFYIFKI